MAVDPPVETAILPMGTLGNTDQRVQITVRDSVSNREITCRVYAIDQKRTWPPRSSPQMNRAASVMTISTSYHLVSQRQSQALFAFNVPA